MKIQISNYEYDLEKENAIGLFLYIRYIARDEPIELFKVIVNEWPDAYGVLLRYSDKVTQNTYLTSTKELLPKVISRLLAMDSSELDMKSATTVIQTVLRLAFQIKSEIDIDQDQLVALYIKGLKLPLQDDSLTSSDFIVEVFENIDEQYLRKYLTFFLCHKNKMLRFRAQLFYKNDEIFDESTDEKKADIHYFLKLLQNVKNPSVDAVQRILKMCKGRHVTLSMQVLQIVCSREALYEKCIGKLDHFYIRQRLLGSSRGRCLKKIARNKALALLPPQILRNGLHYGLPLSSYNNTLAIESALELQREKGIE